jgi:hypothetical protein
VNLGPTRPNPYPFWDLEPILAILQPTETGPQATFFLIPLPGIGHAVLFPCTKKCSKEVAQHEGSGVLGEAANVEKQSKKHISLLPIFTKRPGAIPYRMSGPSSCYKFRASFRQLVAWQIAL